MGSEMCIRDRYKADQVKNVLSLKSEGAQPLSIATFGSGRKDPKLCSVARVATKVNHGPGLELIVFSVPHIYKPLTAQPISLCAATWDHHLTLRRLDGLLHRLKENPTNLQEYDSIIHDQIDKKVVEVIADTDLKTEGNQRVCLLYTSPSPRDATLSRMPSSA